MKDSELPVRSATRLVHVLLRFSKNPERGFLCERTRVRTRGPRSRFAIINANLDDIAGTRPSLTVPRNSSGEIVFICTNIRRVSNYTPTDTAERNTLLLEIMALPRRIELLFFAVKCGVRIHEPHETT